MAKCSPTSLSMALLRREGFTVAQAERWIPRPGRPTRVDMLGVGDLLACRMGDSGPLLVQTTSLPNLSSRTKKAKAEPRLKAWLGCGGRFELHGWSKRDGRWTVRRVQLAGQDLQAVELTPRPRRRRPSRQRSLWDLDASGPLPEPAGEASGPGALAEGPGETCGGGG
jgi:hypothetical protein